MGINWPLHKAQPVGAKLNPKLRISPTNWSDTCSSSTGRDDARTTVATVHTGRIVTRDLGQLSSGDFEPFRGDTFVVTVDGAPLDFVLAEVRELAPPTAMRDPFSLLFHGPPAPLVAQGIHHLEH